MELIFHADDLGATPGVSRRILECWRAGLIGGFSLLMNGTGLATVGGVLEQHPEREARISVHLNLSDGKSLLPPEEVPGLVDRGGYFRHGFMGLFLHLTLGLPSARGRLLGQIEGEWREQIRRAKGICPGRKIRAIDGHIHEHMLPFLFPIAARLAVEEGIPEIRIPRELWSSPDRWGRLLSAGFYVNSLKWLVLRVLSGPACRIKRRLDLGGPPAFIGVLNAGRNTELSVMKSLERLRRLEIDSCEILFHVGGAPEDEVLEWRPLRPTFLFLISDGRRREYEELVKLRRHIDGGEEAGPNVGPKALEGAGRQPNG